MQRRGQAATGLARGLSAPVGAEPPSCKSYSYGRAGGDIWPEPRRGRTAWGLLSRLGVDPAGRAGVDTFPSQPAPRVERGGLASYRLGSDDARASYRGRTWPGGWRASLVVAVDLASVDLVPPERAPWVLVVLVHLRWWR
eukprot:scaffold3165_cov380-Prasinococcus_capsulatus_cf.AAC.16